jgi:predicted RNA-binding protein with PUA-like domain
MGSRRFWLMKSEPDEFSIDNLINAENQTTIWSGVRNYQARNFMRDDMKIGDGILFYHSNAKPLAIVGSMTVSSEPYPDPTQFDPDSDYFDPKSSEDNPRWYLVNVTFCQKFEPPVLRETLQNIDDLQDLMLLQKGSRLSIQPVSSHHWNVIHELAGAVDSSVD